MNINRIAKELKALLKIDREVVGVKLVYSKENYYKYSGEELNKPLSYCVAVKSASLGHSIKLNKKTGGCLGGNRALGLSEINDNFKSGKNGYDLGLYKNREISKSVANEIPKLENDTYGIIIKPLQFFEAPPDVVLIISNTREAMRILQGYTCTYGLLKDISMSGNQAVCVEATLHPIKTNEMNISMFCSGTRYKCGWKESEVISGISISKIEGLIEGLKYTVNAIEMNDRKKEIEKDLKKLESLDFEVDYEKTYFKKW